MPSKLRFPPCVLTQFCTLFFVVFVVFVFVVAAAVQVCPVAIKYNKIFVDAFWNSRRESFGKHLFRLLTSWALVCDIYFLEPQNIREGERG